MQCMRRYLKKYPMAADGDRNEHNTFAAAVEKWQELHRKRLNEITDNWRSSIDQLREVTDDVQAARMKDVITLVCSLF